MPDCYYIPTGPANLATLFPAINWGDVEEYYVTVDNIATTPLYVMSGCEEDIVISFINYLGTVDQIGFSVTVDHESKSGSFQRPLTYPLQRAQPGIARLSIKANDNYTGSAVLEESQMALVKELIDSPLAWMQQGSDYIPIVITDQSIQTRKDTERFGYEVVIKWSLSHEKLVISN